MKRICHNYIIRPLCLGLTAVLMLPAVMLLAVIRFLFSVSDRIMEDSPCC